MGAYHWNINTILCATYRNQSDKHNLAAYNSIKERINRRGHTSKLQILNNKASGAYKELIERTWNSKYQLIPPNVHCCNAAELAICMFKPHFFAIFDVVDSTFPP